ncbi:ribosomal-protein-serine acetyltransferase [Cytobacillus purgationiresistens]|uniref:Ribosomal-protein-serine acetyltransferase n=2 Tax=Cytobacillus purgationiresistens TaxID=863449 RepID=A0ABU0AJ71_9BACI|nr:ribosomal-protein-serine acetyltransferase [Cytobacillus purgationiresistens]
MRHTVNEEISLRTIEQKDAEIIFQIIDESRTYLRDWLGWVDGTKTLADSEAFVEGCLGREKDEKSLTAVIVSQEKVVGIAGFNEINHSNKTAYIGYWLGESYQGNGIMTKVARALTDYAFQQLDLNKVEIRVAVENMKSRSIPEKLGFKEEGCIRQAEWLYDHYVDLIVYGMLASEWRE